MANDVFAACNFRVEIEGVTVAGFTECSGLSSTTDVIEYREGGDVASVRLIPGLTRFGPIVLQRGIATDELFQWRQQVVDGAVDRRAGSIILLDEKREEQKRWNFYEGWPSRWEGPRFRAISKEIAIETLEIQCERIERA
jgi:phage tail-like protein